MITVTVWSPTVQVFTVVKGLKFGLGGHDLVFHILILHYKHTYCYLKS